MRQKTEAVPEVQQLRALLTMSRELMQVDEGLAGVALYSYASPDASRANADPGDDSPDGFMWDVLTRPAPENDFAPPFAEPVAAPR